MTLSDWGWSPFFTRAFDQLDGDRLLPACVVRQDRQQYQVQSAAGTYPALLLGRMLVDEDAARPAVGDWVAVEPFDDAQAVIHAVLPRRSAFERKRPGATTRAQVIAANVDLAFLVSGLDHDFNLRRIERYLVQAAGSGARPVILLNKADVCDAVADRLRDVERIAPDVDVLALSAVRRADLDRVQAYLKPGVTAVFLGSSGVGKSTLINGLLGEERLETGAVRTDDSRGRHTTTHRALFRLPEGGLVIDTPGLREVQLWSTGQDLDAAFPEIEALAVHCRFRDCAHETEPGCAVQAAVADGSLADDRYQSYLKLQRELRYLERRSDEAARYQERQRAKQFGRLRTRINRHNPKR